ncbi:S100 calcium binding protein U isoform X1 [Hippoglossus hippoglossus]|uniref:S100 calcium binding protein U isoform X1 n=1 Tax=Hippoglossus hippoglossus TaxID=8267 RepID=UPI00148C8D8A|nr:S100 calcium binding protein U isoform X1 [Hippoglossus hippoglossus]XP_034456279.1 S100 calcium binding protein U isoform X1 [Hippoglossus hippoglossus]
MEDAIQTLVKVFLKSTKGKENLGKKEFHGLVKSQLSNILSDAGSKEAVNNMGQGLDENHDGKVGFEEYMKLVGYLAVSLSDQRTLAKEKPAQNAASGQVAQSAPDKEEEKPEATAEATEEAKPVANEEAKAGAAAEVKVEANTDANLEVKVAVKEEGETQPDVAKEEPAAAVAAAVTEAGEAPAAEVAVAAVEVVVKEEGKMEETVKVGEVVEKVAAAVEEEVEKKTEEATS